MDSATSWYAVALPHGAVKLPNIPAALSAWSALPEAERARLVRDSCDLASFERRQASETGKRSRPINIKLSRADYLALLEITGTVSGGYRVLRLMAGAVIGGNAKPKAQYTVYKMPDELISRLPQKAAELGELLQASLAALTDKDRPDAVKASAAADWAVKQTKTPSYPVSIRTTPDLHAACRHLGRGNASAGVRCAFRYALGAL